MDITVLELHLPDAQFNAPFAGRSSDDGSEGHGEEPSVAEFDVEDDAGSGGRSGLVALVVLAGLAALTWYLRSGRTESDEIEPEESVARGHA